MRRFTGIELKEAKRLADSKLTLKTELFEIKITYNELEDIIEFWNEKGHLLFEVQHSGIIDIIELHENKFTDQFINEIKNQLGV